MADLSRVLSKSIAFHRFFFSFISKCSRIRQLISHLFKINSGVNRLIFVKPDIVTIYHQSENRVHISISLQLPAQFFVFKDI